MSRKQTKPKGIFEMKKKTVISVILVIENRFGRVSHPIPPIRSLVMPDPYGVEAGESGFKSQICGGC